MYVVQNTHFFVHPKSPIFVQNFPVDVSASFSFNGLRDYWAEFDNFIHFRVTLFCPNFIQNCNLFFLQNAKCNFVCFCPKQISYVPIYVDFNSLVYMHYLSSLFYLYGTNAPYDLDCADVSLRNCRQSLNHVRTVIFVSSGIVLCCHGCTAVTRVHCIQNAAKQPLTLGPSRLFIGYSGVGISGNFFRFK